MRPSSGIQPRVRRSSRPTWVGLVSWIHRPAGGGFCNRGPAPGRSAPRPHPGQAGAGGDLDEIDLAGFLEGQPELPGGQAQQAREALDRRPFGLAQLRLQQGHQQRRAPPPDRAWRAGRRSSSSIAFLCSANALSAREATSVVHVLRRVPVPVSNKPATAYQRARSAMPAVSSAASRPAHRRWRAGWRRQSRPAA